MSTDVDTKSDTPALRTPTGVWTGVTHHDDRTGSFTVSFAPDGTVALRTPRGVGVGVWSADGPGRFSYELTEIPAPEEDHPSPRRIHVEAHLEGPAYQGTVQVRTPTGATTSVELTADRVAGEPAAWHDVVSLGASIRGRTLLPGDDGFEQACSGWLLTVEHRPAAVVVAADADDVAAAVRFAAEAGRPVAVQSTGHGKSVPADGAVFVATGELRELSVDPRAGTARIGAGLRWDEVIGAAAEHGLAPLCGSSGQVGVMGFLTGGGLPLTGRTYGFAADRVRSLDVVTADGLLRTVSPTQEPDLFWAVRGGKSNFGIVVAAEIELLPLRSLYGGRLHYPVENREHAAHVLRSYLAWAKEQPEEMSSSVTLLRFPDAPQLPEELRGRSLLLVLLVYLGEEERGARLMEPLRALGPEKDTCAAMPYARITEIHQDPRNPVMTHLRSALLTEPDDEAVAELVSFIDPAKPGGPFPGIELRHLGGALDRPPGRPHAVSTQGAAFHLWLRMPAPPDQADAVRRAADEVLARLRRWDTGAMLPGFLFDHDSAPERVRRAYTEADHRRLSAVKAAYDPNHLFRINHTIPPAQDVGASIDR
ncbi:FAD-binding oxidoreductase [Nonomuraea roseoviolacea]|uniref:FAD/FMN-containing dehydrogenase n=1 Tax=Nonomuraea roseoviolacea subsp. carminata TaxID=160689 RepID=A0ABT1KCS8_9ACTN|nr:FAD-binding protein [Nonomuraea roseoviolacea]MCP2351776.1 FAD/FMN-containing dehydrogenase [Nonomuraea roseoviolacea subsp. carminata]